MTTKELERRVERLEQDVTKLKQFIGASGQQKDWRQTVGMFDNDPLHAEIIRLGRAYRRRQNRKKS